MFVQLRCQDFELELFLRRHDPRVAHGLHLIRQAGATRGSFRGFGQPKSQFLVGVAVSKSRPSTSQRQLVVI